MTASAERSPSGRRVELRRIRLAALPRPEARELLDDLLGVVAASMTPGVEPSRSWAAQDFASREDQLCATAEVYLARDRGEVVGFIAYRIEDLAGRPAVHLLAACIEPAYQSSGLGFAMVARIVFRALLSRPGSPYYLAAHIVNPVALAGWRSRILDPQDMFPHLGEGPGPSDDLVAAACEFAERSSPGLAFDKTTGVISGKHVPGDRLAIRSGDPDVDDLYREHVRGDRGDTVLMLLDGNRTMIRSHVRVLASAVPRAVGRLRRRRRP